ncbi:MAG: sulfate ABC transporter permease subunit CysT [Alphaproteobacteria bacterium 32-64-14]|nr:MAG: sulfate ABC transporter permease subunit CysT [Alphaproteobacteria bacterium 32-64-14]
MTPKAISKPPRANWRRRSVLPGFGLSLGYTIAYLSLVVLIPLAGLGISSASLGWNEFWAIAFDPRVAAALQLSFGAALLAAIVNTVFGVLIAWVLVRYRFPGRRWLDAAVDLPFALPTAVAGIALATLYAPNGVFGATLESVFGLKIGFSAIGVVFALIFVGLPFVVRTVQPVLEEIDRETEEVSATLGAGRWRTVTRVIMPGLLPAILTGFALSFARGVGEYGSVIFIANNLPFQSEIAPLLIVIKLDEHNYAGATAIATIMLVIAFVMLFVINLLQAWSRKWFGHD